MDAAADLLRLLDIYAEEYSVGIMTVVSKSRTTGFTTIAFNGHLRDVTGIERVSSIESSVFVGFLTDNGKAHEVRPIIQ